PKLDASGDTAAPTGFEYAYFDAKTEKVDKSPYTLDSDNGALFHTLDQIFGNPGASTGWILYNDEEPNGTTSFDLGHTKGVLGFDAVSKTAFWLLHSWPKFPTPEDTAQPSPMFGQTFLCIALDLDSARELAPQMHHYQEPQVYSPRIPTSLAVDDPLRLLTTGITPNDPAGTNTIELSTRGGAKFLVIAKNRNWNDDFWNDLVVVEIKASIDVDTWIRGKNVIPGSTDPSGKYKVEDIKFITLQAVGLPWEWKEVKDHAKWAISEEGQGNWVCVGDINRMISQRQRGGCTIAFKQNELWAMLSETEKIVPPEGVSQAEAKEAVVAAQKHVTQEFKTLNAKHKSGKWLTASSH